MNELSEIEIESVSGAGDIADAAQVGSVIGAALGAGYASSMGATGSAVLGAAGIGAAYVGGLAAAGAMGYAAGSWLNNNTRIQEHIADGLEAIGEMSGSGGGAASGNHNLIARLWE